MPTNIPMKATIKQFEKEHVEWEKILQDLNQENALLKYRLSEIVDDNEDHSFLQMAEYFQNELLLKDETLKKLIKQRRELAAIMVKEQPLSQNMIVKQQELRIKILRFEKKFVGLSREFNEKMVRAYKN